MLAKSMIFLISVCVSSSSFVNASYGRQVGAEPDHYITSLPLGYPKVYRQSNASRDFYLYGNPEDSGYRDVDPLDGIDDRRNKRFMELATQFAPYTVLNSTSLPMDFKRFSEQKVAFPLRIDTWDLSGHGELTGTDRIDLNRIGANACPELSFDKRMEHQASLSDDCRLLQLLVEFDPEDPQTELANKLAHNRDNKEIKILYIDYPGYDENSWKKEYEDGVTQGLKERYLNYPKIYGHPFIHEVKNLDGSPAYEFVMQYWLFYPYNDGGNNHEGDWEHINVVIAPKDQVAGLQTEATIRQMIDGSASEELVMKRVEYYFHHYVTLVDYSTPNVYAPHDVWQAEVDRLPREQVGLDGYWKLVRNRVYWDDGETEINTHPLVFVGADNKGWDQFLASPGGKNRDSHGSYPFPGLYRSIGPAGASEEIKATFDHRAYYRQYGKAGIIPDDIQFGTMYPFDSAERIEIIPDWERVRELNLTDSKIREDWYWMTLPIFFGFPRAESPFSTIVAHVDMGNLAVHGPAYNSGWNASGPTSSYTAYTPHAFPSLFPLGFQDNISNNLGWLNAPAMILQLPPFDVIIGLLSAPFRAALGTQHPIYFATEHIPDNFFTVGGGISAQDIPPEFRYLNLNTEQVDNTIAAFAAHLFLNDADSTTEIVSTTDSPFETGTGPLIQISFNVGSSLITENTVRHIQSEMANVQNFSNGLPPLTLRSKLNFWDYTGSLRYNLATGGFRPYGRAGYGITWFRMEETAVTIYDPEVGQEVTIGYDNPTTDWIAKWTWSYGLGIEVFIFRSQAKLPRGLDLSLKLETGWFRHDLGVKTSELPLKELINFGFSAEDIPQQQSIVRRETALTLSLGF